MTTDAALRAAAVAAAVLILVAPKWGQIASAAVRLAQAARDAAKAHGQTAARVAAAGLIVAAAWGQVPIPSLPASPSSVPSVAVEEPSEAMKVVVSEVGKAMAEMNAVDRAIWADAWNKAALVVAGDGVSPEVAFTDTKGLRAFTALAVDIAWRRIGGKEPGTHEDLRVATEAAYARAMGVAEVAVTKDMRAKYAEFARAMAWAGYNKG